MADKREIRAVQGMVAGTLRQFVSFPHMPQAKTLLTPALFRIVPYSLHSLRLMKRDGGWIHSLLEEVRPSSSFRTVRIPLTLLCLPFSLPPSCSSTGGEREDAPHVLHDIDQAWSVFQGPHPGRSGW